MSRPPATSGMHHIALFVEDLPACEKFYTELLGMTIEWRPDDENVYLTSGNDNLALHQAKSALKGQQRLDHIGFILKTAQDVDAWYGFLNEHGVPMRSQPRTHRDGARSFYCEDPAGVVVQMIYHPPLENL
jgi:catechol 2,3-dioxygenase-like lactoylglutathione lyase family enzyme